MKTYHVKKLLLPIIFALTGGPVAAKFAARQPLITSGSPVPTKQPPTFETPNTENGEVKKTKDEGPKLHMANPFYLPYDGEWQISIKASHVKNRVRTDIPAQTFFGNPQAAMFSDSERRSYALSVSILYGIANRFSLGIGTDFYFSEEPTTTKSGSTSTFASPTALSGSTGPELRAAARFAGIRPGQVYLDLLISARPGIGASDSNFISVGRPMATGTLATGINFGLITLGIAGSFSYAPAASGTKGGVPSATTATGAAVGQFEWKYGYVRGSFGLSRNIDSTNASNGFGKSSILTYGAGGGIKFTDATLLDFDFAITPEIRGDGYNTGYGNAIYQYNTVGPITRYALTFSFKL